MTVNLYWASDDSGTAITEPLNHGSVSAGSLTSVQTIYLYHDGTNDLTGCALYLGEYSGSYDGGDSASNDLTEILDWGDQAVEADFGGVLINMDAVNSFATDWSTYDSHTVSGVSYVFNNTYGPDSDNAITLSKDMSSDGSVLNNGVIPANQPNGYGTDFKFQMKVQVPTNEATAGKRQFDLGLLYTYTS
jgi:hypothetical protein